jgi:hypothetical protein
MEKLQPSLRFPEFKEDWKLIQLNQLLDFKNGINASKEQYGKGYKFINVLDILNNDYINYDNIETEGELFIFKLTKINMKIIILKYGGYAHGTKQKLGEITIDDLENPTNDKEYAIRPKYGDKCWNELLQFRIQEI